MKKISILVALITAVIMSSCQKDDAPAKLKADNGKVASDPVILATPVSVSITGNYGNLPTASDPVGGPWGSIGYSLSSNSLTGSVLEVAFTDQFNGNVTVNGTTWFVGYKDISSTSLSAITRSSLTAGTGVTWKANNTLGPNSATDAGWYNYTPPGIVSPVTNRYVVVTNNKANVGTTATVYVLQLSSITPQINPANSAQGRGIVAFNYVTL
jgi:hypothetical protein